MHYLSRGHKIFISSARIEKNKVVVLENESILEENRFKLADNNYSSFAYHHSGRPTLVGRDMVVQLEVLALDNDFELVNSVLSDHGDWKVYARDTQIRNFYQDDTQVHSALGVYRPHEDPSKRAALLRASEQPFSIDDVVKDLKYFQRTRISPPFLSFNFANIGDAIKKYTVTTAAAAAVGIGITMGIDSSAGIETYSLDAVAGAELGLLGTTIGWIIAGHQKSMTNPAEYFLNERAKYIFDDEQSHALEVSLQYALFESLGGENVISPERFMGDVYDELPNKLKNEIFAAKNKDLDGIAFQKLLDIAKILSHPRESPYTPASPQG